MLLGALVLRRQYTVTQVVAVAGITTGLIIASLAGGTIAQGKSVGLSVVFGVTCLAGALLSRASSGVLVELYCKAYDASVAELLFYRSALGVPVILLQWQSIVKHAGRWTYDDEIAG